MKKVISIILAVVLVSSMLGITAFADVSKGDVNADGSVSAIDARMILQHVAELNIAEDTTLYDVNGDGNVSAVDARIVLQIVAGLYQEPVIGTEEEQLAYFVNSFNGVKENATSVTLVSNKVYNYNNHLKMHTLLELAGGAEIREELSASFSDEPTIINQKYKGEEIQLVFPPIGGSCNLTMADISSISVKDADGFYEFEIKVKGKMNPERNESVGNVASIVTKEDFEAEMSTEDLEKMEIICDYKEATVIAKIEKETGNMEEYSVDYPMILVMNYNGLGTMLELGMGLAEEWTATYK